MILTLVEATILAIDGIQGKEDLVWKDDSLLLNAFLIIEIIFRYSVWFHLSVLNNKLNLCLRRISLTMRYALKTGLFKF